MEVALSFGLPAKNLNTPRPKIKATNLQFLPSSKHGH
jgi:hypothetical protein